MHEQLRVKTVQKDYLALVRGQWQSHIKVIQAPLLKNELSSGERIVRVSEQGKPSETRFSIEERYINATLVKASPVTGRTHQIRVHTQYAGHPIALDDKYGDKDFDKQMNELGLNRLFLHAFSIRFEHLKWRNITFQCVTRSSNESNFAKVAGKQIDNISVYCYTYTRRQLVSINKFHNNDNKG